LFQVATGATAWDDPSLGRITIGLSRRTTQRLSQTRDAPAAAAAVAPGEAIPAETVAAVGAPPAAAPAAEPIMGARGGGGIVFRADVLPPEVEARRAVAALKEASEAEVQGAAVAKLQSLAPVLLELRDTTAVAEVIAALDEALPRVSDAGVAELAGTVAGMLADGPTVARMVARLGEARVPPAEREVLIKAAGALAAITTVPVLEAFVAAPADLREPYRAVIRAAADRAVEPLQSRLDDRAEDVVAAAAEFLGLTGSPAATSLLVPLTRHRAEVVRERALIALAEIGGREVSRPAVPALKDESAAVRAAAARTIGVGGDPSAGPLLARRLDGEADEGVQAELLRAIGKLGGAEALEVLVRWAEPGGRLSRRTPFVRTAAIEGLAHLQAGEARALLELYRQDKDPAVRRAAEVATK
jgi:HEAT repeat protein